ncbi:hypothetical protein AMECASPLE_031436 [Ameca splendens]|uniref:Uncharacterized protein n=1 Tax=Ameca splendens TaxID=208324 RepID=A0ABV0ZT95_9TELE
MSCSKANLSPSLKCFAASNRFSSRTALYVAPSIFPTALTIFPVPVFISTQHRVLLVCYKVHLTRAPSSICLLCPLLACGKLQTGLAMAFFQQMRPFCHSSMKDRFAECTTCVHLSCRSVQDLQSWRGLLGCPSS